MFLKFSVFPFPKRPDLAKHVRLSQSGHLWISTKLTMVSDTADLLYKVK